MPASRPRKTKQIETRMRVAFNAEERSLISKAAGPDGLKQAAFVRATVVKALSSAVPVSPTGPKGTGPRTAMIRTYFNADEEAIIARMAAAHGLSRAELVRHVVLTSAGQLPKPTRKRTKNRDELLHALSVLAVQLKKLGANVNQLAHQANAGIVPVTRTESQYMLNAHQILLSKATAAVESLLA